MKLLKRLLCRHNRKYLGREFLSLSHHYICTKCGKDKYVYEAECSKVNLKTMEIEFEK